MADKFWMEEEKEREHQKGTEGAFGKATSKKIAAGKKAGGVEKKRAVLAQTFKRFAHKKAMGK